MAKSAAREVLSEPSPGKSRTARWLRAHPKALEFVDTWIEIRRKGETDWGLDRVVDRLRDAHDFPLSKAALYAWIRKFRRGKWSE